LASAGCSAACTDHSETAVSPQRHHLASVDDDGGAGHESGLLGDEQRAYQ
jgi:hypothetical protein